MTSLSEAARARMEAPGERPLFLGDWTRVVMIHLEVDADALQRSTPFPLDLHAGRAFVSLVAFHLSALRFARGGAWTRWLTWPVASHAFLNLRTYVRVGGEPGIFFLAEWIPNPLSQVLGPLTFGLPYRLASIRYGQEGDEGTVRWSGRVVQGGGRVGRRLEFEATGPPLDRASCCPPGGLDEWLMERYTAFTWWHGVGRRFRVWHEPWRQVPVGVVLRRADLIPGGWEWFREGRVTGAHASVGVTDVWMGCPRRAAGR